jgi:murein L,D-transpeptidase YcbB/YkuD
MSKGSILVVIGVICAFVLVTVTLAPAPQMQQQLDVQKLMTVQKHLKSLGYTCECTGKMDQATTEALKKFQAEQGLTADGICGPITMKALVKAAGEKAKTAAPTAEEAAKPEAK